MEVDNTNIGETTPVVESDNTAVVDSTVNEDAKPVEQALGDIPTEERKFTQEEIDTIVGKRLAREQRKWQREQQALIEQVKTTKIPSSEPLSPDNFQTTEAYAQALAEKRAHELLAERKAAEEQTAILNAYHDREEEARNKYDDFAQVAYNPNVRITEEMAQTIRASEIGPELAYHLGSNPSEALRIANLSPLLQAKELGKIEAKLIDSPPVKKVSAAPPPINRIKAATANHSVVDTTDPRSTETMSTSEWIEAERKRQMRKWQAQRQN